MRRGITFKIISIICIIVLFSFPLQNAFAKEKDDKGSKDNGSVEITAKSAVLLEGSSGTILFDKNKDEQLKPASITKIMTLLLIFEAIDNGDITLKDEVSVSEHAASMGGSQVFLEPFETQTVDTMIKCISISSANDAAVAMAEHIAGSEEEFVKRMNERAKQLGMVNTNFENCCGLDTDNHYSSAYDVALMSRELIVNHKEISKYSTVWMDTITHVTKKGESEFGLSNTNKLVKTYKGITGLKTGSTSLAKYCLSATANRDGMDLIAVVMGAEDPKTRFSEAAKLLDYGFANVSLFVDENKDLDLSNILVAKGVKDTVQGKITKPFTYVCFKQGDKEKITKKINMKESIIAPVKKGAKIGEVVYEIDNKPIGTVAIVAGESVEKAKYNHYFNKTIRKFFCVVSE